MIKMVRLDERMIYGQIVIKWSRILNVDRIIVANDAAASNDIVKKSLMMAAPGTCKVAIKSVAGVIELMKNPKAANHDILIIVANPKDLLEIVNNVEGVTRLNIGNYGRISEGAGTVRKKYTTTLYCTDEEADIFREIIKKGIECNVQVLPDDMPEPISKIFK